MQINNRHLWFISISLLIGSVFLFIGGPDYYTARSLKHLWDMGHILYFALFTLLLLRWNAIARLSLLMQWTVILSFTLFFGICIELMQYGASRTPNMGDVLRDIAGSLLVLVFGPLKTKLQAGQQRNFLQFSVIALMLVLLWPLTKSLIDEATSRQQFPILANFETTFEIERWENYGFLSVESVSPISNNKSLKVSLTTERYSGTKLRYFNGNWVSAKILKISFYNPDENPLQINLRIHDIHHNKNHNKYNDRFNRKFILLAGWNLIEVDLDEVQKSPLDRNMDMSFIRELGVFSISLAAPRTLYIDEVKLIY